MKDLYYYFFAILYYCIVSGRPTVSFYMHLQWGLKVENSTTWNYEKYSTVGGFQQPEWYKRKDVQKDKKYNWWTTTWKNITLFFQNLQRDPNNFLHSDTIYP